MFGCWLPSRGGVLPGREVVHALVREPRDVGVQHRDVDVLALAGQMPVADRGEDRDRRVHSGHEVGDRDAHLHRLTVRRSGDAHDPAHRLDEGVVGGPRRVGSGMAEAGHRAVDERREIVLEVAVPEPVLRKGAGLEVLRQDVASRDEPAGDRLPLRVAEVEGDGTLVAVRPREVGALRAVLAVGPGQVGRSEVAGVVAGPRPLDLDDLRAEVAQDLGAVRPGQNTGEVEDDEAVERTVHCMAS